MKSEINYEAALSLWVADEDEIRVKMQKPFVRQDIVCATDGHALIAVKDIDGSKYQKDAPFNVEDIIKKHNFSESVPCKVFDCTIKSEWLIKLAETMQILQAEDAYVMNCSANKVLIVSINANVLVAIMPMMTAPDVIFNL